jgi:long-chain fatty acid transport protein
VAILGLGMMAGATAQGGGFKIPDQSTRAMGMMDAFVAGADDASAIYYNPAGLTRLDGLQAIGNLYLAHANMYYSGPDGDETSDGRYYTVPNMYLAAPIGDSEALFWGLGVYSPFGLGSRWADDSAVRYTTTLAEIQLVNINPTLAYKVGDRLAIGVGVDYFTSRVINRLINNYDTDLNGDGILDITGQGEADMDAEGDGWGYNFGLQWQCSDTIAFGLTYRSRVELDYEGSIELDDIPPAFQAIFPSSSSLETAIEYPASATAAISWQKTPKLRLEFAAEWTDWSSRDEQTFDTVLALPTTRLDWDDSWVLMLGAEYRLNEKWMLRGGYGFNETPAPKDTADPSLPTGDTHAISIGASYQFSKAVTLDTAFLISYGTKQTLESTPTLPKSDYDAISTLLSFGITYQF